ncbi:MULTISPECIES: hypothetical protein [Amycolatopsis]|uniref:Uncharacterized protein n=1 Tax=Amycolatopsis thermalba TaxID=944492 RepID=A0ABY4NZC3_9PSEU|nr:MULTISPECIES: hypothetical protein [Amycolatopsis]UQS25409.1 hypothetical protein L1857_22675 [Amycolatopsis thermalba]
MLVVVGLLIRVKIVETPAFRKMAEQEGESTVPARELVRDRISRRHLLLGMGSRLTEGVAFNAWAVFVISYGSGTLDLDRQPLLQAVMIAAVVMVVFIPIFGRVSDRIGTNGVLAYLAVTTAISVACTLAIRRRDMFTDDVRAPARAVGVRPVNPDRRGTGGGCAPHPPPVPRPRPGHPRASSPFAMWVTWISLLPA